MELQKKKLRRLANKMQVRLRSATLTPYGHRVVYENGLVAYRDKKGWIHATIPIGYET